MGDDCSGVGRLEFVFEEVGFFSLRCLPLIFSLSLPFVFSLSDD